LTRQQELTTKQLEQKRKREALEARILALRKEFEAEEEDAALMTTLAMAREAVIGEARDAMARSRKADVGNGLRRSPGRSRSRVEKTS
jgi:hypothetical protein